MYQLIKKNIKIVPFLVFNLIVLSLNAQIKLDSGFMLLDNQRFDEAKSFFENVLLKEPNNISAMIGFGRALGLKGNAEPAFAYFDSLSQTHPKELEILLNRAEAILWKKEAKAGEINYLNLLQKFPDNYVAYIGLGNALAMQQRYEEALARYEKSAELNPSLEYTQFLIKSTMNNLAYQLLNLGKFEKSKQFYFKALARDTNNVQSLSGLVSVFLAQDSLKKAAIYAQKLSKVQGAEVQGLTLLGYTQKLQGKINEALATNETAYKMTMPTDTVQHLQAMNNLIYAHLWNRKINKAAKLQYRLNVLYPMKQERLVPQAQVYVYQGKMRHALGILNDIRKADSSSFDGNLGLSDLYLGLGNNKKAWKYIQNTLKYYPFQKDALFVKKKVQIALSPDIKTIYNYFSDNQQNTSQQYTIQATYPIGWLTNIGLNYQHLDIGVIETPKQVMMKSYTGWLSIRPALGLELTGQITNNELIYASNSNEIWLTNAKIAYRFEGGHSFEFSRSKERFYYTASLLEQNLFTTNNTIVYNGKLFNILGIYANAQQSKFSDENKKRSLYASLYYNVGTLPLKTGISQLYLSFDLQVPFLYYSPERMISRELFIQYNNYLYEEKKWQISAEVALGQLVEKEQDPQILYRFTGYVAYRFGKGNNLYLRAIRGNSSQAQLNLYAVTLIEAGAKLTLFGLRKVK